jgi:tetratricopeptide (TPR) repeat protein
MSQVVEEIKRLKDSAKGNRNFGQYEDALADLDAAIALAQKALDEGATDDPGQKTDLLLQLADCYGMKGGVYRRFDGRLDDALAMYRSGLEYEQQLQVNTYNLSNVIAISLVKDGAALPSLLPLIGDGIRMLGIQVQEGGCRTQEWWAYADLGLFYLLCGRWGEAREQYARFRDKGAEEDDYDTTIGVLQGVGDSLRRAQSPIAPLVEKAIDFLSRQRRGTA